MENNMKENDNDYFRQKFEELYRQIKYKNVDYKDLYESLYNTEFYKITERIKGKDNTYPFNIFIYHYEKLKPFTKDRIYDLLYHIIKTKCNHIDKNAFINFIFENENININHIYTHVLVEDIEDNKYSLLMIAIKYNNVYLFDKLMANEHIDYKYDFKKENISNSILDEAVKIYGTNNYYFDVLIDYKDLYTHIQQKETLISVLANSKMYKNILHKLLFHKDFVYKNDYICILCYINENDLLYDIFEKLYEKHKDFIKNNSENNVYEGILQMNLIHDNFKTLDFMIEFINDKEIMKYILKNNKDNVPSLYERIIEKKNSLKGKSIKSELYKSIYEEFKKFVTKLENICETEISDEIICKNQYTCNICLDECSENRVYKKCTTCNVIFHNDCLIDYFGSCNTSKCCYCQNNSNFIYIYE